MICKNLTHQRLLTGLDTRKNEYAARTPGLSFGDTATAALTA